MTFRLRAFFLAIVAFAMGDLLLLSSVSAQNPFDKFKEGLEDIRPKGELLRKIFGDKDDDKRVDKKADSSKFGSQDERQKRSNSDPRVEAELQRRAALAQYQRQQLPQGQQQENPSRRQQPTLAPQQASSSQRYPADRSPVRPPALGNANFSDLTPPPLPPQRQNMDDSNTSAIVVAQPVVEPMALQPANDKIDLGIAIRATGPVGQSKGLLIEMIDNHGFGAKSGLRKGDLIVGIGGIGARNEEEFNSIASVMRPGDQIEFEIIRKGKSEKIMVQFGESPDAENDLEILPSPPQENAEGNIGDLNIDLSHNAPVDHVASSWSGSDGQDLSTSTGKLRSVLVNEPWPNAPTTGNRR